MIIETERLVLRPLKEKDAPFLSSMMTEPEVYRYILKQEPWSQWKVAQVLRRQQNLFRSKGFCLFGVALKGSGELTGYCGAQPLEHFSGLDQECAGMSWVFQRKFWGAGLATEAASAFLDYAFFETGLENVKALIHPANRGSSRVAGKIGFEFEDIVFRNGRLRLMYSLSEERFFNLNMSVPHELTKFLPADMLHVGT